MRGLPRIDLPRLCRPLEPEADPGIKPLPWALGIRARAPAVSDRTDRPRGAATCQRSGSVGPGSLQIDPIGRLKGTESCTTVFSESTQGRAGRGPARPFSLCSPLQTVCQPPARVFLASRLPSPRAVGRPGKAAERRRGAAGTRFGCSCGAPSIARIGREAKRGDEQRSAATNEAVDRRSGREGRSCREGSGREEPDGSAGEKTAMAASGVPEQGPERRCHHVQTVSGGVGPGCPTATGRTLRTMRPDDRGPAVPSRSFVDDLTVGLSRSS